MSAAMMALFCVVSAVLHSQKAGARRVRDRRALLLHSQASTPRIKDECDQIDSVDLLKQIRTEIEYLIHSDFHINAWTGGEYPTFPDDVLLPVHNHETDDLTPKVTVNEGGVNVTFPITTKVMLKPNHGPLNIQGTMSGEVVCQVVGPDAARYTTCQSDAVLHINPVDNDPRGFKFKTVNVDVCLTSSIKEISTCPHDLKKRRIGVRQKAASARPILAVDVPVFGRHMRYEYHLLPDTSDKYQLRGVGMSSDSRCLVLHTQEPAVIVYLIDKEVEQKQIVLCPPEPIRTLDDGVQQWLDAFPEGKELLWQLCVVGPKSLFQPSTTSFPVYDLCSHMGLRRKKTHAIKWHSNKLLKLPFYDANPRSVSVKLRGILVTNTPCSQRSQSAAAGTGCRKEQRALDELIDISLQGLTADIGKDRRCQIIEDMKIVRTEGLEHLIQKPFFFHL